MTTLTTTTNAALERVWTKVISAVKEREHAIEIYCYQAVKELPFLTESRIGEPLGLTGMQVKSLYWKVEGTLFDEGQIAFKMEPRGRKGDDTFKRTVWRAAA